MIAEPELYATPEFGVADDKLLTLLLKLLKIFSVIFKQYGLCRSM